jgi:dTMP kinase
MAKYIVFDGMDGSGKGTQMKLLEEKFGDSVIFTREPGGTPFAEEIRKIVRDNPLAGTSTALNNFLLFWAAREELQHNLIVPALKDGKHVFSDRGDSSTYAFQLWGEEHQELKETFERMRALVFNGRHKPDLYVIFDLPAEAARERVMRDANRATNHFDERDPAYYGRVREGFYEFAERAQAEFIDATRSPEEVHQMVLRALAAKGILV